MALIFCKGNLSTYRFCDNVWTLVLKDVSFKTDNETINVDNVKIVACDGISGSLFGLTSCRDTVQKVIN
jgi:hypothetical protein